MRRCWSVSTVNDFPGSSFRSASLGLIRTPCCVTELRMQLGMMLSKTGSVIGGLASIPLNKCICSQGLLPLPNQSHPTKPIRNELLDLLPQNYSLAPTQDARLLAQFRWVASSFLLSYLFLLIFGNLFFTRKGIKSLFPSMSKLLLLVQTEADVAHLDGATRAILNLSITGVWLVFSPAITVNASEAATKLDAEIETLKTAERQAADRGDYTAAAGYKTQREGKELDRAKALRDAWKTAPAEERQARIKSIFGPFGEALKAKGLSVRITGHSDHYDRDQWVAMLNSLSGVWFREFTPGGFVVGWPEAVATSIQQPVGHYPELNRKIPEVPPTPKTRREELEALHPMKLGPIMRSFGLDHDGLSRNQKINAILAYETAAPTPVPELAEY